MPDPNTHQRLADHPRMPRVGSKVANRYEVIDLIGEGGFAVVYRARDTHLGGLVALKVLEPSKSMDQAFTKRFEQEINLVRELRQHNSIKIWDAGTTEWGCLYYAMELVEGEELARLINRTRGLPINRVVRIVSQVLRSLGEAHKAGIVHRDLKPGNIMVCQVDDEPDYVKVLDFGIAKARSEELTKVKTQTGMVMCTPNYAAPELLRNQEVTPASDLYALGLIMAEMVTGQQAVQAPSLVDIITIQVSPAPLAFDPRLLATPIGKVIAKATAKNIAERYQSAAEMLVDLRAMGTQPPAAMPVPPTPGIGVPDSIARKATTCLARDLGTREVELEPIRSKAIPIMIAVVLLLAVAVVALWRLMPGDEVDEGSAEQAVHSTQSAETGQTVVAVGEGTLPSETELNTPEPIAAIDQDHRPDPAPAEIAVPEPEVPTPEPEPTTAEAEATVDETDADESEESGGEEVAPEPVAAVQVEPSEEEVVPNPGQQTETAAATTQQLHIALTSDPSRARVYVEGEQIGRTPIDELLHIESATVEIMLRKTDYGTERYTVTVTEGAFERHIRMRRERSEPEQEQEHEETPTFEELPLNFGD